MYKSEPPRSVNKQTSLMLVASLVLAFSCVFSAVFAEFLPEKCPLQLAEVVYAPKTQEFYYLENISKVLIAQTPLLFGDASQAHQVLSSFVNQFNVIVHVHDAFGAATTYGPSDQVYPPPPTPKSVTIARSILNFPAFTINEAQAFYTFVLFNAVGEEKTYTIIAPVTFLK